MPTRPCHGSFIADHLEDMLPPGEGIVWSDRAAVADVAPLGES
jgi:hypothetical protein